MTTTSVQQITAETVLDLPSKDPGEFTYGGSPEEIAHDNYRRATFAAVGLVAYAQGTGIGDETPELAISDLLGDLRHLCDSLGLDFDEMSDRGERHYLPESKGDV